MIAPEDIEAILQGEKRKVIRQRATVRLFNQAKEQGGVFTGVDVATMMRLSPVTISKYVREYEKENQKTVLRRGTIHDIGPSITHKRQICYKVIVEGKGIEEVARETDHFPEAITRYVKDYKRILTCLSQGLTPRDTSFVAKVSENLVYEYLNLIQENQIDIKEQMCLGDEENFDDIPF